MPDLDVILNRLRDGVKTFTRPMTGETYEVVLLADAEVAVREAADTRTREIVEWLRSDPVEVVRVELADLIERRFPCGDTTTGTAGETSTSEEP